MTDAKGTAEAVVRSARGTTNRSSALSWGLWTYRKAFAICRRTAIPFTSSRKTLQSLWRLESLCCLLSREELPPFDLKHNKARAKEIIAKAIASGEPAIAGTEALEVLECYGFNVPKSGIAKSEDEAVSMAKTSGYPLVMKIVSTKILHKSDIGGVVLNVKDEAGVRESYKRIMANALKHATAEDIEGILVQTMVPQGEEVLLGINRYSIGDAAWLRSRRCAGRALQGRRLPSVACIQNRGRQHDYRDQGIQAVDRFPGQAEGRYRRDRKGAGQSVRSGHG